MTTDLYIESINRRYHLGNATEHTFRGDLQQLVESLAPQFRATNEPKRQSCGAPDYIITKKDIPIGYIEAKAIGDIDLDGYKKTGDKEQFDRYKSSLGNIIFTDYLNFHWYKDAELVMKVSVGKVDGNRIIPLKENFRTFELLLKEFCSYAGQTIKSPKKLAEMMAGKARLLADIINKSLNSDDENEEDSSLKAQFKGFQQVLIHDITNSEFSDVYAQTLAYGMFAARLYDPSLENFSRQEAAELIPKSNPFLRKLFSYIAGVDIDDRIRWVVDGLADLFLACDVGAILKDFGRSTKTEDPIIHFYETFLAAYDPGLRKARGVWYTPHPVVSFIVRAVDYILKTEFGLPMGLADSSKTKIAIPAFSNPSKGREIEVHNGSSSKGREIEVHRVQILDPATGTATFLVEFIRLIHGYFIGQQGIWNSYVEQHLIPRLNGFELLMASYAMAHLKLDLVLRETGFTATKNQRFKVFLTNSLEPPKMEEVNLFMAQWLSQEAHEADVVKRETPVMVIAGNPPYSGESANKGDWIMDLMEDYKKEHGGVEKLKEKNPKWINDDYVKFIRYGQYFVEKNGSGILAFINPHGFLDNPTFRGMRWQLLKTFDKIFTIDLHGNAKKKETTKDGSPDENVFDIQQGVSINLFIKTGKKKPEELGKAYNFDLFGLREAKYDFLNNTTLDKVPFVEIPLKAPMYFMVQKDFDVESEYMKGFSISELMPLNNVGIVTARDNFTVHFNKKDLKNTIDIFLELDDETARSQFKLGKDVRDWQINFARKDLKRYFPDKGKIIEMSYRPFDKRWTFYTGKSKGFHCYPRYEVMQHFLKGGNVGLCLCKQFKTGNNYVHVLISTDIIESSFVSNRTSEITSIFPLYLHPEATAQQSLDQSTVRIPNLNMEIVDHFATKLNLKFTPDNTSPPLEGCPQGGVVSFQSHPTDPQGGVVPFHSPQTDPTRGVVPSHSPQTVPEGRFVTTINNIPIKRNFVENLPYNPTLKQRAKEKRKAGILSEVLFWQQVHKGVFHNIDFDRQRIIGNYIVDFYVKTLGLVIEIDGSSHDTKVEYDQKRQQYLESFGLKVYRIPDHAVKQYLSQVMVDLERYIVEEYGEKDTPNSGQTPTPACGHPSKGGEFGYEQMVVKGEFEPMDLLDYVYAVLHSPEYRLKYKEFLKIDFPRIPYPSNQETFWKLVELGGEIRQLHLLESQKVNKLITTYPISGNNEVKRKITAISPGFELTNLAFQTGKVWINDNQYFDGVPMIAWNFYVGGYQPAQKWLKDRNGRILTYEDILHYQKIIVALTETDKLMKEIDEVGIVSLFKTTLNATNQ